MSEVFLWELRDCSPASMPHHLREAVLDSLHKSIADQAPLSNRHPACTTPKKIKAPAYKPKLSWELRDYSSPHPCRTCPRESSTRKCHRWISNPCRPFGSHPFWV